MSSTSSTTVNTAESTFVKEQLKRAAGKGASRYPTDYTPRDTTLIKRKSLLPVPPQCLADSTRDASTAATAASASSPEAADTVTLTIKTLTGQAHKLHVRLPTLTCAQLHALVRTHCGVHPTANMRLLRQGRVVPDSEAALTAFVVDASVPLNLIEQQAQPQPQGKALLTEAFWKDFEAVVSKHVADAASREKVKKGFKESFEQWL